MGGQEEAGRLSQRPVVRLCPRGAERQDLGHEGECLYFLTDGSGRLRYVGETKNRVADRWRTSPALCATTGRDIGKPFVFHNRAWRPLEAELVSQGSGAGPFLVSVLQGAALAEVVGRCPGLRHLVSHVGEGRHLAKLVQDWLCGDARLRPSLWNVAGTGRRLRNGSALGEVAPGMGAPGMGAPTPVRSVGPA